MRAGTVDSSERPDPPGWSGHPHLLRPAICADMVDDEQQHVLFHGRVYEVRGVHLKQHAVHLCGAPSILSGVPQMT